MGTHPHSALVDRCRGALLGTAVGDAIGAPFEGQPVIDAAPLRDWAGGEAPLRWTDDTHMMIGVAESLVACGGVDPAHMAQRFADDHRAEPWRGYGAGPPRVFEAIRGGAEWDEPARGLFDGQGSFGNGAAMRVAPIGVLAHRDPPLAATLARTTARITHAHPRGQDGAAVQAYAIAWLIAAAASPRPWTVPALLAGLATVPTTTVMRDKLAAIPHLVGVRTPEVVGVLGHGLAADEAVPAAAHAFVTHADSLHDTVLGAVEMGGDTDTIAAMAGALAGAAHGTRGIPRAWIGRLEASDRITHLADELVALALASPTPGDTR